MFTVYTEDPTDHAKVTVIANHLGSYTEARRLAKQTTGIVAYTDHFDSRVKRQEVKVLA